MLIVGPPGAGKSTHAQTLGLKHLEYEQYGNDHAYRAAVKKHTSGPDAQCAVVRCCPTEAEQRQWESLCQATETMVLDVPADECERRIKLRGRPGWREELLAARRWHAMRGRPTSRQW